MIRICQFFLVIVCLLITTASADQPASDTSPALFAEQSDPIPLFTDGEDTIRFSLAVNAQCAKETSDVALNLMIADTVVTVTHEKAFTKDMATSVFIDVPMNQLTGLQTETICERASKNRSELEPMIRLAGAFSVQIEARCSNPSATAAAIGLPLSVDISCVEKPATD